VSRVFDDVLDEVFDEVFDEGIGRRHRMYLLCRDHPASVVQC
jgi:hypothetical protein